MDSPITKYRHTQYRGPSSSSDYNDRIEENYRDLALLINRARLSELETDALYRRMAKEHLNLARVINSLEQRLETLEGAESRFTFFNSANVDTARFDAQPTFAIDEVNRLSHDTQYGIITLPKVDTSSLSKLFFVNNVGEEIVPSGLEMRVVGVPGTADTPTALIDTSEPELALYRKPGLIWERNVIVPAADPEGAEMVLYARVPTDLFTTNKTNAVLIHPFPSFGTTIREISYSTAASPFLEDTDGYVPINADGHYTGEEAAKGWVAPGGWEGAYAGDDALVDAGPRIFYFSPPQQPITALRIRLHQPTPYREAGQYIYSYGLSRLDMRYDKFLAEGRIILRFDAPEGQVINTINDVQPQIFNVPREEIPNVFDYRTIWETSFDSGEYTDEMEVALSQRVWIEVTLRDTEGWTPALSGLTVDYS